MRMPAITMTTRTNQTIRAILLAIPAMMETKALEGMFTIPIAVARDLILCLDAQMTLLAILTQRQRRRMAHVYFLVIPATMV